MTSTAFSGSLTSIGSIGTIGTIDTTGSGMGAGLISSFRTGAASTSGISSEIVNGLDTIKSSISKGLRGSAPPIKGSSAG